MSCANPGRPNAHLLSEKDGPAIWPSALYRAVTPNSGGYVSRCSTRCRRATFDRNVTSPAGTLGSPAATGGEPT